jgi:hypothetical protein
MGEPVSIGQGWFDIDSAPTDGTVVWLTDGERVISAAWLRDVHDCPGWRDERSFDHFRRFAPLAWQPYFKPKAPGWQKDPRP